MSSGELPAYFLGLFIVVLIGGELRQVDSFGVSDLRLKSFVISVDFLSRVRKIVLVYVY